MPICLDLDILICSLGFVKRRADVLIFSEQLSILIQTLRCLEGVHAA